MTFPAQLISYFNSQQYQNNYNLSGTYQFTVPEGVSSLSAVAIGGGGGGAGSDGTILNLGTGGGGGGGATWAVFGVQPGDVLTVNVATGGTGGTDGTGGASFNGVNGGTSSISIASRTGVGPINENIMQSLGGGGGTRGNPAGIGGDGGIGGASVVNNVQTFCPIYLSGGGTGGSGGTSSTAGASGGGGAGGYNGNGGNGGRITPASQPTAAATDSGGGGGGGGATNLLGYGGGGLGGFGFIGSGQGSAGSNDSSGGGGASYFIDPNEGIVAEPVGQTFSITDNINYPLTLNSSTGLYDQPLEPGDFLLLLSATDSTSGITQIPVPSDFTVINQSYDNGVYRINSSGIATAIVPSNITTNPTRDLNFTTSFRIVPATGLSGTLSGLTTSSIHTMIVLRGIPSPISISWATGSGDPGIAPFANTTLMPDPPSISGIAPGSVSIIAGFLANNILNAVGTAGANTFAINEASAGLSGNGLGVGLCASYIQTTGIGTTDPDSFLTGTASHARAYSLQINKSDPINGDDIIVVGSAVTFTPESNVPDTLSMNLPLGVASGDLLVLITASDNPATPPIPTLTGVTWSTTFPISNSTTVNPIAGTQIAGWTRDIRGGGGTNGLGYRILYGTYNGGSTQITSLISSPPGGGSTGPSNTPAAHMVIAFRNVNTTTGIAAGVVWDNAAFSAYGPPDPPSISVDSNRALVLAIGMIDNIKISNVTTVTAPTNYQMLAEPQSYGVQNNGAIIMTANRNNVTVSTDDPGAFVGNGGNIWVSQTIIISGPTTTGTKDNPGFYGGGGGSMSDGNVGSGMTGGQGSVRIIWGTGRRYPSSNQVNQSIFDSVPP